MRGGVRFDDMRLRLLQYYMKTTAMKSGISFMPLEMMDLRENGGDAIRNPNESELECFQ